MSDEAGSRARPPLPAPPRPWHATTPGEALSLLESGPGGLAADEVARRLALHGANRVEPAREDPWWQILARQVRDPLVYVLLVAAGVTWALGDLRDTAVILVVVVVNSVLGFVQEQKARRAIRGLARLRPRRARVVREGREVDLDASEVVPGDIVVLAAGDRVPADLRLLDARELAIDESMLTGESIPADKDPATLPPSPRVTADRHDLAFAGTLVTRGRGRGVAVGTGVHTELGRIADTLRRVEPGPTPLETRLARFGRQVGVAVLVLCAVVMVVGILRDLPAGEMLLTAVALAVAAIPEGLPVVLTVTLAVGVSRMAGRRALIRTLPAVETLGSTTVVATDKTGTLTENQMTVREVLAGGRTYTVEGTGWTRQGRILLDGRAVDPGDPALEAVLTAGILASDATLGPDVGGATPEPGGGEASAPGGDPTEIALLVAAARAGLDPDEVRADHPRLDDIPFDPDRRYMAVVHGVPGDGEAVALKGAPETLLPLCSARLGSDGGREELDRAEVEAQVERMAGQGLRVLAMAAGSAPPGGTLDPGYGPADLLLLGLQGMEDPVRPAAAGAVEAMRQAGMRVLMLTGDHLATARTVAGRLGFGQGGEVPALEGRELERLDDRELEETLGRVEVYARVEPAHKLRVVQALRRMGEVVAVTGDGVNDAPALHAAHLGVAMGRSGTDVSREASDMILADDDFATLGAAVEEGRVVFSNVRKVTFFLLSTAVGEVLTLLVALFAGWPLPLVAAQILWVNLVTDGLQDIALAFERGEPGLAHRAPRPMDEGVLTPTLAGRLLLVGALVAAGTLAVFLWSLDRGGGLAHARTVALTQLVVFQLFHAFNCRSLDRSLVAMNPFTNPWIYAAVAASFVAHLGVLHLEPLQAIFRTDPLSVEEWLVVAAVGATILVGGELDKLWNRLRHRHLG